MFPLHLATYYFAHRFWLTSTPAWLASWFPGGAGHLMLICTGLAICASTVSSTSTSPRPAKFRAARAFAATVWVSPGVRERDLNSRCFGQFVLVHGSRQ